METIETYAIKFFNDFELSVVNEPIGDQLLLFDKITSNVQSEQFEIFKKIEKNAPFINAGSFSNQVHFQNAYQTPVQRWFPYREGYSTRLVNAFIKELKITGNIFDPFSGSGTTMVQACELGIHAVGVDVSAFNSLIGNCKVTHYDIKDVQTEINRITKSLKSFLENSHTVDFETRLLQELNVFNTKYFPVPDYNYTVHRKEINEKEYGKEKELEFNKAIEVVNMP